MNTKKRIRIRLAYDGTEFTGFQVQPDQRTVQSVLQEILSQHCGEPIRIHGAGRTDAGVHAAGQVAHFDTSSRTPPERYPEALHRLLPRDVKILESAEVGGDFHARFSASSRKYRYAIVPGTRSPLLGRFAWTPWERPDWSLFGAEAKRLEGERDFRLFRLGTDDRSTIRNMFRAEFREERGAGCLTLEANAFLHGMVRWIVGALWARATGKMGAAQFEEMLSGQSRPPALVPAPPQGLCLVRVRYPGD